MAASLAVLGDRPEYVGYPEPMCRALRVLCAAADAGRVAELKRATVSTNWELVGGASSLDELVEQLGEWQPDVVVIDAGLGPDAASQAREARPTVRIVSLGSLSGADEEAISLDELKPAILGLPRPGGPVRS
jgi:DNA-binding NarL/FixJ family response regulator